MKKQQHLALFASGKGSNVNRFITYFREHSDIHISLVISNNPNAGAIHIAEDAEIPCLVIPKEQWKSQEYILGILEEFEIDYIILAGFLLKIPRYLVTAYEDKILNIHPALLPKYGGKGMYGMHVHEAVIKAGEIESGITIHKVNAHYDEGEMIFQAKTPIQSSDTAELLAQKIQSLEHKHFPVVIEQYIIKHEA